jgi:reactive chlorine resistance protein C
MGTVPAPAGDRLNALARRTGELLLRYGLVLVFLGGAVRHLTGLGEETLFTLVANHPLLSATVLGLGRHDLAVVVGVVELVLAVLIALRPVSPRACALGSALAVGLFALNLTFLATTPGVWLRAPAPSDLGESLLKDAVLLGAALWSLAEAVTATHAACRSHRPAPAPTPPPGPSGGEPIREGAP